MKRDEIPAINTYTTMRDVLFVMGITPPRYTTTTTTKRGERASTTERVMQEYARYDGETATAYVSRIDAIVDSIIDERD